jgi:hypothetical protein
MNLKMLGFIQKKRRKNNNYNLHSFNAQKLKRGNYVTKMYFFLSASLCCFLATLMIKSTKNEQSTDIINPSGFVIHRGINISHWLSQVYGFSKRDVFFTKDDIRLLDSLGFDHIVYL